jgi:hypothetical protein
MEKVLVSSGIDGTLLIVHLINAELFMDQFFWISLSFYKSVNVHRPDQL